MKTPHEILEANKGKFKPSDDVHFCRQNHWPVIWEKIKDMEPEDQAAYANEFLINRAIYLAVLTGKQSVQVLETLAFAWGMEPDPEITAEAKKLAAEDTDIRIGILHSAFSGDATDVVKGIIMRISDKWPHANVLKIFRSLLCSVLVLLMAGGWVSKMRSERKIWKTRAEMHQLLDQYLDAGFEVVMISHINGKGDISVSTNK